MAKTVNILSQAITEEKSRVAVRQLERLLQDALNRLAAAESEIDSLQGGIGVVSSVTGVAPIAISPTTGNAIVSLLDNGVSNAKLRDSAPLSVIGRSSGSAGDPADISSTADGQVLGRAAGALSWALPSVFGIVSGTGTSGRSTRWTGTSSIGNGAFLDDGTNVSLAGGLTLSTFTPGSVLFAGPGGLVSQDNTHFFWDNTNDALTVTTTTAQSAIRAINADAAAGAMSIQNTNVNGPVDFYALGSDGASKMSWGYGNASYTDTARVGRAYVWRNAGINFVFARTNTVDGMLFSDGNWNLGTSTANPNVKLRVEGQAIVTRGTSGAVAADAGTALQLEDDTNCYLTISGPAATRKGVLLGNPSAAGDGALLYDHPSNARGWAINAANATAVAIQANGNVRIGSTLTDPGVKLRVDGDLTTTGNATLGDNASSDSHAVTGAMTVTSSNTSGLTPSYTGTAQSADRAALNALNTGTFDATAAGRNAYAVIGSCTSTRSAGANNLTNHGGSFTASGGQVNIGVRSDGGASGFSYYGAAGLLYNAGDAQVDGNCTFGNAVTDSHTISGATSIAGPSTANALTVTNTQTGMTAARSAIFTNETGSYNTTAGAITYATIQGNAQATRSAGANNLTSIGLYGNAINAQVNYSLYADAGNVLLNASGGGSTTINGATTVNNTLTVTGNCTFGDAASDTATVSGILSVTTPAATIPVLRMGKAAASTLWGIGHDHDSTNFSFNYFDGSSWSEPVSIGATGTVAFGAALDANTQLRLSQTAACQYGVYHTDTNTGQAEDRIALSFLMSGTFDCTAAGRIAYGVNGSVSATRSAGANNLTNIGIYADASGGQVNYSFFGNQGTLRNQGDLQVTGSCSLGDGSADIITINGGPLLRTGTGSPESVITAPVGSLYLRTDGGANTTLYVKESGSGNTGWVAK
jgi:hypothetical protein